MKKVHTIIGRSSADTAQKYKEFEKNHTIVDVKYPTANMILVFYEETLRFEQGEDKYEQVQTCYAGRSNAYRRDVE